MRQPRIAEVDLIVDDSWNDVESRRVDRLVRGGSPGRVDGEDPAVFQQQIDLCHPIGQDAGSAVNSRSHDFSPFLFGRKRICTAETRRTQRRDGSGK